ncbi:chalcone isomerase family protein [Pseudomonas turukhanskensis]|uniref:Chalcone isomerase domain-containing protein n=1 Tax=Pseudomonas turukhanskensis TaxID=1806536 RepID=A0A9W6NEB3_9PSED|nr:chalcone isomerase family protein [Pseudomonas turukhanskensis]GLK88509.1 hypothetical protein GCM10017655_15710 [Pseudomonas turukhanskensis]
MGLANSFASPWRGAIALCVLLMSSTGWADWRSDLPEPALVGQGDFTWFGLRVYHARLWSGAPAVSWEQPFALELTYLRELSRDTLVEASLDEMRRLGAGSVDDAQLAAWGVELRKAFVDVQPGQRITGVYLPGKGGRFYVDSEFRHAVTDVDLSRAFFAIWLDTRTRNPQLRRELLGLNETNP